MVTSACGRLRCKTRKCGLRKILAKVSSSPVSARDAFPTRIGRPPVESVRWRGPPRPETSSASAAIRKFGSPLQTNFATQSAPNRLAPAFRRGPLLMVDRKSLTLVQNAAFDPTRTVCIQERQLRGGDLVSIGGGAFYVGGGAGERANVSQIL